MRWHGLVLLSVVVGCTAADPLVGRKSEPVFGGAVDGANSAVVSFLDGPLDGPHEVCSAVVVGPRVVLTAAHCVKSGRTFHVQLGTETKLPTRSIPVSSTHVYPGYSGPGEDQRAGLDLAIAITTEDLGVPPVQLPPSSDDLAIGASLSLVGFGQSSKSDSSSVGTRRSVLAQVTAVCDRLFAIGDEARGFCGGDSGGAVLRVSDAGPAILVGLISFGVKPACAPPGYAVRIAPYARWIASFVMGPSDPTCATTCPPRGFCGATQRDVGAAAEAALPSAPPSESGSCAVGAPSHANPSLAPFVLLQLATAFSFLIRIGARWRRGTSRRWPRGVVLRRRVAAPSTSA